MRYLGNFNFGKFFPIHIYENLKYYYLLYFVMLNIKQHIESFPFKKEILTTHINK